MKAVSFIDKSAEFQTNRLMDKKICTAFSKVGTRRAGHTVTSSLRHFANTVDINLKLIKTIRFNSQITSTFGACISQMCMCITTHQTEEH